MLFLLLTCHFEKKNSSISKVRFFFLNPLRSQKVKTRGYLFKRVKNDFLSQLPADQFICLQYRPFLLPSLGDFSNLTSWYPMLKLDNI